MTTLFGPPPGESVASALAQIYAASSNTVRSISDVFLINRNSARSSVFFLDAKKAQIQNDSMNTNTSFILEDEMCFDWLHNKALGNKNLAHGAPLRRVLVVDTDQLIAATQASLMNSIQVLIMVLVALWVYDFMRLRSFLDVTYVEFASADSFVLLWAKPWECYLKNDHDATEMLDLIHKFNRSHKVHKVATGGAESSGGNSDLGFSSTSTQQHVRSRIARVRRLSSIQQRKRRASGKVKSAVESAGSEKIEGPKKHKRRFSREQTDEGDTFFVDEISGESVWELPDGAVAVGI